MEGEVSPSSLWLFPLPVSTWPMYKNLKQALKMILMVILLSSLSLIFGVVGRGYVFGVLANLPSFMFPLITYQGLTQKLWGKEIFKVQCLFGSLYVLTFLIMDSILIAYIVSVYRYCYGDWTNSCKTYHGPAQVDFVCSTSANTSAFISCPPRNEVAMQLSCYCVHMVATLFAGPYIYTCQILKGMMPTTFTDLSEVHIAEENEIQQRSSKPLVIMGNREEIELGDVAIGVAVDDTRSEPDLLSEARSILPSSSVHVRIPQHRSREHAPRGL